MYLGDDVMKSLVVYYYLEGNTKFIAEGIKDYANSQKCAKNCYTLLFLI